VESNPIVKNLTPRKMNRFYTKEAFLQLDFDDKCTLLEALLTDDFYNGQREIGFYIQEDFKGEIGESLPEAPIDIKIIEDDKFENLISRLSDKLFENKKKFEFDLENYNQEVEKSNEIIFNSSNFMRE
jgi:hypothetical protein